MAKCARRSQSPPDPSMLLDGVVAKFRPLRLELFWPSPQLPAPAPSLFRPETGFGAPDGIHFLKRSEFLLLAMDSLLQPNA